MQIGEGNLAIVTGAASGMGLAVSQALSKQGIKVAMLDINGELIQRYSEELGAMGFVCDVSSTDSVEEVFNQIRGLKHPLRVAINCAGIAPAKRMVGKNGAMPLADFQKVIDINLVGTFNIMRMAAETMSLLDVCNDSGERGVIINTASIAAFEGQIGQCAYSASKGGVVGMTLPAARELAQFGIRVNTIAPGIIETPMLLAMPQEVQEALSASVPFPKRMGKPAEFASLVNHIIENTMINGEVIRLDGAIRMQPK